ncbi:HNH/ENDO VII family nuclease, partial [bacterium]|nr:HNH/ENDO VII family nuclease [bacterium]
TIAAAAFVGSATSLAYSVADAGAKCDTWDEFADYGETAMINTEIGCGIGMLYGAGLEAANAIDQKIVSHQQSKTQTKTKSQPYKSCIDMDEDTSVKRYADHRPPYGKGQVEQVWENAKNAEGKVIDPTKVEITWDRSLPRNGQWDMGHIPGEEYSRRHQQYMDGYMTDDEFLAWYRNPANYRPELPSTNRSHKFEWRNY